MPVKDAVAERFCSLCKERGIRANELATLSGVTPSTVYSMLDPRRREVSITTIKNCATGCRSLSASSFLLRCSTPSNRRSSEEKPCRRKNVVRLPEL